MINEFKQFIMRGNVIDLAVGFIMGAAFSGVVKSLVEDIIMPPIGYILGDVDFSEIYINLSGGDYESLTAAKEAGAATINVGVFLNVLINFLIVAFAVFLLIKAVNRMMAQMKEEAPPAEPTEKECPHCFTKIPIKATRCPHCTSQLEASKSG
jgi:large conductance mechanosensitive channel